MKVVVLAAGYATRMYPLTRNLPKPLLEVAGKPILTHLLARASALPGVDEFVVVGNHRFQGQLRAWVEAARGSTPIRLLDDGSTDETNRLGALGDLAFALREIPLDGHAALVAAGDNLVLFDLAPLAQAFARTGEPQIAVRSVPEDAHRSRYGEVSVDATGRITEFREKPADPRSHLASIALYLLPARIWPLLTRYLAGGGDSDAPGHFFSWLVRETPVHALPITGPWWDIGDLEALAEAREKTSA